MPPFRRLAVENLKRVLRVQACRFPILALHQTCSLSCLMHFSLFSQSLLLVYCLFENSPKGTRTLNSVQYNLYWNYYKFTGREIESDPGQCLGKNENGLALPKTCLWCRKEEKELGHNQEGVKVIKEINTASRKQLVSTCP